MTPLLEASVSSKGRSRVISFSPTAESHGFSRGLEFGHF
jgi:hypothetical protein